MRRLIVLIAFCVTACTPLVTPAPTPTVPAPTTAPTQSPTKAAEPIGLSVYREAMRPEFAAEVDRFGQAPQYQIDLEIAPDRESYSAQQQVRYTNTENTPLHEVYFSVFANMESYGGQVQVQSARVNEQAAPPKWEEANTALRFDLVQPLLPGEAITIDLAYTGTVPTSDVEQGYNQFGLHQNVLALPNFYPQIPAYDARGWNLARGPGYGDAVFSDTALYQVNITAPADEVVVTSGVCDLAKDTQPSQGFQTWRCVSGPMRDFMIAMSPAYQAATQTVDEIKINSYYLPEDAEAGQRGLEVTADAMQSYEKRFGPYPFDELDLVETPTSAGGIEYPGLIVVAQDLYEGDQRIQEGATAHEAAHQWWYSLVGDDQVHDPWLDEALAQFTTALYYRDRYGARGMDGYVQTLQDRYDRVKGTADDKRGDLPVAEYSPSEYGAIVYGKAALFFNAIYDEIGDAKFNQLLQEYFETYRYGVAYPKDLLATAAKYVGQAKLDELLKEWITTP